MRLWERYRPRTLTDVCGRPFVPKLRRLAAEPHECCLLFEGPGGVGKTSTALAFAADLGVGPTEWQGLYKRCATDMTIEECQRLFNREFRLRPMGGSGWKVLLIEELEAFPSVTVQRYLKGKLDPDEHPPRLIVIATSNGAGRLDPALLQRFKVRRFDGNQWFGEACAERIEEIWAAERTLDQPLPPNWLSWGETPGGGWSFRLALSEMEDVLDV